MKPLTNSKSMVYSIMALSTIMAISSTSMIMVWLSMELNLFSFILLLMNKFTMKEIEASMDYFLSQTLGSMLFLMGSASIFNLHWFLKMNNLMLVTAITMKLGIFPCYYWFPTVMEKISLMNCFILMSWQKVAPLFIMMYSIKPKMSNSMVLSCMNALMGSVMGLSQMSIKKIMAYSSIAHMGWMTSSLMTNTPCLSIAYFIMYTLILTPLFVTISKMKINFLYKSWYSQNLPNMLKLSLIMSLLSLAGLPPLMGFFPKLLMMNMLLKHSMTTTYILVFSSLLSLFFYLSISLNILMKPKINKHYKPLKNNINTTTLIISTSTLSMIFMII